jgi:hypothetical protein
MTARTPTPPPAPRRPLRFAALVITCAVLAFTAGRWAASEPTPSPAPRARPARGEPARPTPSLGDAFRGVFSSAGAAAPAVPPPAPAAPPPTLGATSPELVQRVAEEASGQIENLRSRLGARCAPRGGGDSPASRAVMTLTFDRHGREIARGVAQGRAAASAELGGCLRSLPPLEVSPPGANVGVTIRVSS